MSSPTKTDVTTLKALLEKLLACDLASMERTGGGRNSQVYRLTCGNKEIYAGKVYYPQAPGERNRLEAEFSGLQFLWNHGVRNIPRPVATDKTAGCAVYEYIEGSRIAPESVTTADIDAAAAFLADLKQLTAKDASRSLPPAAEACFSVKDIIANMAGRLDRLISLPGNDANYRSLHDFLEKQLVPFFNRVVESRPGPAFDAELPYAQRTLSPSDFGFHNALRRPDDRICFLDFEYFGWDDPAKMVSDFLLHPGMELARSLKQRFFSRLMAVFANSGFLDNRMRIVYPLFGIKWCLILLNEFVPEFLARRGFAINQDLNKGELQLIQLAKARRMLSRVMNEYEHFPYHV
jgi:hypothetical protein